MSKFKERKEVCGCNATVQAVCYLIQKTLLTQTKIPWCFSSARALLWCKPLSYLASNLSCAQSILASFLSLTGSIAAFQKHKSDYLNPLLEILQSLPIVCPVASSSLDDQTPGSLNNLYFFSLIFQFQQSIKLPPTSRTLQVMFTFPGMHFSFCFTQITPTYRLDLFLKVTSLEKSYLLSQTRLSSAPTKLCLNPLYLYNFIWL